MTAIDGGYARLAAGLERAPETNAHQRALDLTAGISQDGMTLLGHIDLDEITDGPLAILDAADIVPTVAVRIDQSFRERRRDQRKQVCWLLAVLGQVADVRVVCTGLTARWLAQTHRAQLPAEFSQRCNARCGDGPPVDECIETARDTLDPDSRAVRILRHLADEPGETLSRHALAAETEVSDARLSQVLGGLEEHGRTVPTKNSE